MRSASRKLSTIQFLEGIRHYEQKKKGSKKLIKLAQKYVTDVLGTEDDWDVHARYYLILDLFSAYKKDDVSNTLLSTVFQAVVEKRKSSDLDITLLLGALAETDRIICYLAREHNELTNQTKKAYFKNLKNALKKEIIDNKGCPEHWRISAVQLLLISFETLREGDSPDKVFFEAEGRCYHLMDSELSSAFLREVDAGKRVAYVCIKNEWTFYARGQDGSRVTQVLNESSHKQTLNNIANKHESKKVKIQDHEDKTKLEKIAASLDGGSPPQIEKLNLFPDYSYTVSSTSSSGEETEQTETVKVSELIGCVATILESIDKTQKKSVGELSDLFDFSSILEDALYEILTSDQVDFLGREAAAKLLVAGVHLFLPLTGGREPLFDLDNLEEFIENNKELHSDLTAKLCQEFNRYGFTLFSDAAAELLPVDFSLTPKRLINTLRMVDSVDSVAMSEFFEQAAFFHMQNLPSLSELDKNLDPETRNLFYFLHFYKSVDELASKNYDAVMKIFYRGTQGDILALKVAFIKHFPISRVLLLRQAMMEIKGQLEKPVTQLDVEILSKNVLDNELLIFLKGDPLIKKSGDLTSRARRPFSSMKNQLGSQLRQQEKSSELTPRMQKLLSVFKKDMGALFNLLNEQTRCLSPEVTAAYYEILGLIDQLILKCVQIIDSITTRTDPDLIIFVLNFLGHKEIFKYLPDKFEKCCYDIMYRKPNQAFLNEVSAGNRVGFIRIDYEWTLYARGSKGSRVIQAIENEIDKGKLNGIAKKHEFKKIEIQDNKDKAELKKIVTSFDNVTQFEKISIENTIRSKVLVEVLLRMQLTLMQTGKICASVKKNASDSDMTTNEAYKAFKNFEILKKLLSSQVSSFEKQVTKRVSSLPQPGRPRLGGQLRRSRTSSLSSPRRSLRTKTPSPRNREKINLKKSSESRRVRSPRISPEKINLTKSSEGAQIKSPRISSTAARSPRVVRRLSLSQVPSYQDRMKKLSVDYQDISDVIEQFKEITKGCCYYIIRGDLDDNRLLYDVDEGERVAFVYSKDKWTLYARGETGRRLTQVIEEKKYVQDLDGIAKRYKSEKNEVQRDEDKSKLEEIAASFGSCPLQNYKDAGAFLSKLNLHHFKFHTELSRFIKVQLKTHVSLIPKSDRKPLWSIFQDKMNLLKYHYTDFIRFRRGDISERDFMCSLLKNIYVRDRSLDCIIKQSKLNAELSKFLQKYKELSSQKPSQKSQSSGFDLSIFSQFSDNTNLKRPSFQFVQQPRDFTITAPRAGSLMLFSFSQNGSVNPSAPTDSIFKPK